VSNERLQAAITDAGLDPDGLADQIGVDAKTIERWTSGRTPHRRNRIRVARILAVTPHDLWPDEEPGPGESSQPTPAELPANGDGLVPIYLGDDDPRVPDRQELIATAHERIDVLGLTLGVPLAGRNLTPQITERAAAGRRVRVLLAAPDSIHLLTFEAERRPDTRITDAPGLAWETERTIGFLQPLLQSANGEVRTHLAVPSYAVLRVDDQMLVSLHLHPIASGPEPILHLNREDHPALFDRYAEQFDWIWAGADPPLKPDVERYPNPEEHPDRYRSLDPQRQAPRYGAFGSQPPS
jgi:hypothetical protein